MSERTQNKILSISIPSWPFLKNKHSKSAFSYEALGEFTGDVEEKQVPGDLLYELLIREKRFAKKIENLLLRVRDKKTKEY